MPNLRGISYAVLSSGSFGLVPLFSIPLLNAGLDSGSILFYRMGLAALLIGAAALVLRRSFRITRKEAVVCFVLATFYAATSWGLLYSYEYIPSGTATTIHFLYPLCVSLVMIVFFRERASRKLLIAALLSLAGVALLSWDGSMSGSTVRGLCSVLLTVVTYAVYIVTANRSRAARMDPLVLTFYVMTMATTMYMICDLSTGGIGPLNSPRMLENALLLALVPTVFSNLMLYLSVRHIGSTTTAVLGSMEPTAAVIVGVLHFGERFTLESVLGVGLVLVSVIVVILQNNSRPNGESVDCGPQVAETDPHVRPAGTEAALGACVLVASPGKRQKTDRPVP